MAGEWKRAGGIGGGFRFEGWGQLAVSREGAQAATGDGALVLSASEPSGMWRIRGRLIRDPLQGTFAVRQFRGVTSPDANTVVIRYRTQMFADSAVEEWQVAFHSPQASTLSAALAVVMAEVEREDEAIAADETANLEERDADPRGAELTPDELAAAEALMGPAELQPPEVRENFKGDEGEMEDCVLLSSYRWDELTWEFACRWAWAQYWFMEVDPQGSLCARCVRDIIDAGALPDGFGRYGDDDD